MAFPTGFLWGAATSAYQVEGAAADDGRGPSVWDEFCRRPGAVYQSHTGDSACDHYHRWESDIELMKQIGLRAYRFSVSWPRVLPEGSGAVNQAGLGFYDRLVDGLLGAGITPFLTLFHWDYPLALYRRGGWLNRESVRWFADYAAVVVDRLSDRVTNWITINEPQCFLHFGHGDGRNAPGDRLPLAEQLLACHHTLMAHGSAVQVIRSRAIRPPAIGWAPIGYAKVPASGSPEDVETARRAMHGVTKRDLWNSAWYADAVCLGAYPEDGLRAYGPDAPNPGPGDMDLIRQPLDFYGMNIYDAQVVRANPATGEPEEVPFPPGHPLTAFRWPIVPDALYWGPRYLFERYRLPIHITENGLSNTDWPGLDGRVRDPQRIDYTARYLLALSRAIADGADVRGYFHWSLMDNFEWAEGYKERFGLIHVDPVTQRRALKDSAHWYARVIASNGRDLAAPAD